MSYSIHIIIKMFARINYKFLIQLFTNEILYYKHKIILITLKYILVTSIVTSIVIYF